MAIDWTPLKRLITENERFVLTSHVRPDADALGSELAMANILEAAGKTVLIANASAAPSTLRFLDPDNRVRKLGESVSEQEILDNDVHIVLDTSAWSQLADLGRVIRRSTAQLVVIDHHASSDDLGGIEFKDINCEATGTLLFRFARSAGYPISKETAEYLFCAIATDTGWFRFPSVSSETYRAIADLVDCGVEPHRLYAQLFEQRSLARLKLASRILSRVKLDCDGRLGFTTVEFKDFSRTGATPVDTEDMVNQCLTIAGTTAAFIAVEQQNGGIKVSFRSRPGVDVSRLAEQFGGGGHKQASGATMTGPLRVATSRILTAFRELLGGNGSPEPDPAAETV